MASSTRNSDIAYRVKSITKVDNIVQICKPYHDANKMGMTKSKLVIPIYLEVEEKITP